MPVRTKQLAIGDSNPSGTTKTVYTCPAGETAIVKDIRVWGFPGGAITRAQVLISGPTASLSIFDRPLNALETAGVSGFMCLRPGDSVRVLSTGNAIAILVSGAELEGLAD